MKDSRLPLLLGMFVLAAVGVAVALLGLPDRDRVSVRPKPSSVAATPKTRTAPDENGKPRPQLTVAPETDARPVPEAPLVVDSFPPTRHVSLDDWVRTKTLAGFFDTLALAGGTGRSEIDPARPIDGNATLIASGWAGDPQLGLQLHDVVISQCSRLVARARVTLERDDVADTVHPNLERSGWEAVLYASDLAICADPTLRAWAVLPGRPAALLPLNGVHRIGSILPTTEPDSHVSALPPLEPADVAPPTVSEIKVSASRVNLRRCGGIDCRRVGQIGGGRHRVYIANQRKGWSLLVFKDRAGWMSNKLYVPVP